MYVIVYAYIIKMKCILMEINGILYLKILLHTRIKQQHFVRNKMTATHFLSVLNMKMYTILVGSYNLCVPHPISIN